jgi:hypothetical protein
MISPSTPICELDHIVVAADTLDQGSQYLESLLGIPLEPGGQHLGWGTHNRLLRLGERVYLEVIAVDPTQPDPELPRPFGLDSPSLRQRLRARPRLIHWVARTEQLEEAVRRVPIGTIVAMSRGTYSWRITRTDDGAAPGDGLIPSLIQWAPGQHPADHLTDRGLALRGLFATHPRPEAIRQALAHLSLSDALTVKANPVPGLRAEIETPEGWRVLAD